MVCHRSKAKLYLLLCVNACHKMGCLVRARRERVWKTGGVCNAVQAIAMHRQNNALVQDGVHHMGEQRRGGTMGDRKTVQCNGTMGGNTGTGGDECKAGRMVTPGGDMDALMPDTPADIRYCLHQCMPD